MKGETYCRVGDLAVLNWDVEVNAHKDALATEVEIGDGEFVGERHGGLGWERTLSSMIFIFASFTDLPFWDAAHTSLPSRSGWVESVPGIWYRYRQVGRSIRALDD